MISARGHSVWGVTIAAPIRIIHRSLSCGCFDVTAGPIFDRFLAMVVGFNSAILYSFNLIIASDLAE